jgi:hypothetical protein
MNRNILFGYQLLIGLSDTSTGVLLIVAPELTLRLMLIEAPADALVYLSFIGAFVLSVGIACLYGGLLAYKGCYEKRLEAVWLLTALTRACVAIFVLGQVMAGTLGMRWLTVAVVDGACVLIQAIGLRRGWLTSAAH